MRKKPPLRVLRVKEAFYMTPNMIRVTFSGQELIGFPTGREGGNCKLILPKENQSHEEFAQQMAEGLKFPVRTYTVRAYRPDDLELDIDFVAHGSSGPASRWAISAKAGDFCGFRGPSPAKVEHFDAEWYLLAADPSALPLAAVTLENMPRDAQGVAVFEINSTADKQTINAPKGMAIYWLINPNPHIHSDQQTAFIQNLDWPEDKKIQVIVAGESTVIKSLRPFLLKEKNVAKQDAYISGYWKIGLIEDEHQAFKKNGNSNN